MIKDIANIFDAFANMTGLEDWIVYEVTFYILLFGFMQTILNQLWKWFNAIVLWKNQRLLNRDLTPYFTPSDVERATRYYIPTQYQNVAPSEDDEPGRLFIASAKNKLIPLFLKKAFNKDKDDNKYYLILADSGMGKTTFMINLFLAYKNQYEMPWSSPLHPIKLLPLGAPNILAEVDKIPNKENTILLLDAFDEDVQAIHDYKKRMGKILEKVWRFREVVITCRTQFFPCKKEEPHETGYFTYGSENKEYKFQKLYLSVFDDKAVKQYLYKRYPRLNPFKFLARRKAAQIAQKSPNLVVRPMLLNHIEDLVASGKTYTYTYEIYKELINKWIKRESNKPGIKQKYGSQEKYQTMLLEFSEKLALDLYQNREARGGYFIDKTETIANDGDLQIAALEAATLQLSATEKKARSLLNRNAEGRYKFSHKSVLEYFLAKELIQNKEMLTEFDFEGMDATLLFFKEFLLERLKKTDGEFSIKKGKFKALATLRYNDWNYICELNIVKIKNIMPMHLSCLPNLKILTIGDYYKMPLLYQMYSLLLNWIKIKQPQRLSILKLLELLETVNFQELLEKWEWRAIIENRGLLRKTVTELKQLLRILDLNQLLLLNETKITVENIESNDQEILIKQLIMTNTYIKEIHQLQKALPDCKIIY